MVKDNRVLGQNVTLGSRRGSSVVVLKGLKAGDIVVTDDAFRLRPGQLVRLAK